MEARHRDTEWHSHLGTSHSTDGWLALAPVLTGDTMRVRPEHILRSRYLQRSAAPTYPQVPLQSRLADGTNEIIRQLSACFPRRPSSSSPSSSSPMPHFELSLRHPSSPGP